MFRDLGRDAEAAWSNFMEQKPSEQSASGYPDNVMPKSEVTITVTVGEGKKFTNPDVEGTQAFTYFPVAAELRLKSCTESPGPPGRELIGLEVQRRYRDVVSLIDRLFPSGGPPGPDLPKKPADAEGSTEKRRAAIAKFLKETCKTAAGRDSIVFKAFFCSFKLWILLVEATQQGLIRSADPPAKALPKIPGGPALLQEHAKNKAFNEWVSHARIYPDMGPTAALFRVSAEKDSSERKARMKARRKLEEQALAISIEDQPNKVVLKRHEVQATSNGKSVASDLKRLEILKTKAAFYLYVIGKLPVSCTKDSGDEQKIQALVAAADSEELCLRREGELLQLLTKRLSGEEALPAPPTGMLGGLLGRKEKGEALPRGDTREELDAFVKNIPPSKKKADSEKSTKAAGGTPCCAGGCFSFLPCPKKAAPAAQSSDSGGAKPKSILKKDSDSDISSPVAAEGQDAKQGFGSKAIAGVKGFLRKGLVTSKGPRPRVFFDVTIGGVPAGRMVFECFNDLVPKTAENFRCLCTGEKGRGQQGVDLTFTNSVFHRIIPGFMAQGGDITKGDGTGGESIFGISFRDENLSHEYKHDQGGILSMANRGKHTNGSQFFICTAAAPWLDGKHVVFGKTVEGLDVLRKVEACGTAPNGKPKRKVVVVKSGQLPNA